MTALAAALSELSCGADVLTLDRVFHDRRTRLPQREVVNGVNVRRVPMIGHRRFFVPLIPDALLQPYDVVHVHGIDGMFDRVAMQRRTPGQARVATSHGLFFHTPWMTPVKNAYLRTATRAAAAGYDLLIANSQSDLRRLRLISDRVVHLPNGVSPMGDFQAKGRDLLCLGRLAPHKHVERVLAALASPALANVRLHVVGPEWGVSHLRLARLAHDLGIGDRVRLHGALDRARLCEVAAHCGVFVSASAYEGFGMSLIEAMSVGLVPVVHANAAFVELMDRAECGAVTDFTNVGATAAAIREQLDRLDDDRRRRAIAHSKRFSWRGHASRTLELYRSLLNRRQHAA